ncbi:21787_t:CDS:2, partial [Gigaspora rosea]
CLDTSFANITNSAVDILYIESQPLDNISTEPLYSTDTLACFKRAVEEDNPIW